MSETVQIRDAVPGDARALAELARESAETHLAMSSRFYRVPAAIDAVTRAGQQLADPDRTTLVAVAGSQIIGSVELSPLPAPPGGSMIRPLRARDVGIVVSATHRGRGVGRRLMEAAEDRAVREGVELLTLNARSENEVAIALYRSVGFEVSGVLMHKWIG